jgi:hypothetical protein
VTRILLIHKESPIEGEIAPDVYITSVVDHSLIKNNIVLVIEDWELAQKLGVGYLTAREAEALLHFIRERFFHESGNHIAMPLRLTSSISYKRLRDYVAMLLDKGRVAVVKDPLIREKLGFEIELSLAPWYLFERKICGIKNAVRLAKRIAEDILDYITGATALFFIRADRIAPIPKCRNNEENDIKYTFWSSLVSHIAINKKLTIYMVYDNYPYRYKM